jgi:hypothetical protein
MKKCPTHPIDISENREIVECDNLEFPWKQDPAGYFLVRIKDNQICCGFVNSEHKMILEFRGTNPDKIIKEITKREICNENNLAYLAQELMIAKDCLENNKEFVQR